ncbi:Kelch repeat-containing protein [Polyangium spumosum]|nr:kelch repeat-containing protein [Polyangium spumosum]
MAPPGDSLHGARVVVPSRASGWARIEEQGGARIDFCMPDAGDMPLAEVDRLAVYPRALDGEFATSFYATHRDGLENYLFFRSRPQREEVRYLLNLSNVPGLRHVANTIEFLDAAGTPRLRIAPPSLFAFNATSESHSRERPRLRRHQAKFTLKGCRADVSPTPPWGRPVTPPCRTGVECTCEVVVRWDGEVIRYPALLDPKWSTTGSMGEARKLFAAAPLPDGRVLVAGGEQSGIDYLDSVEFYDPSSGTWSSGPALNHQRSQHTATVLASGNILVAGGEASGSKPTVAEVFDASINAWIPTAPLNVPRYNHAAVGLSDGRVLVVGGQSAFDSATLGSSETFDPATGSWTFGSDLQTPRYSHTATLLQSGDILVAGGRGSQATNTTEIRDDTMQWKMGPSLVNARWHHTANLLPDGRVLVTGGYGSGTLDTAEVLEHATMIWKPVGSMGHARGEHTASTLPNGRVLVVGGFTFTETTASIAQIFEGGPSGWVNVEGTQEPRLSHASVLVGDTVIIAGGYNETGHLSSTEVWKMSPLGAACAQAGECISGWCVDGSCCDAGCTAECLSCNSSATGLPDGQCAPRLVNPCSPYKCNASYECHSYCTANGGECEAQHICAPDQSCIPQFECDGEHSLIAPDGGVGHDCWPYRCVDTGQCLERCTSNADCAKGNACYLTGYLGTCFVQQDERPGTACACLAAGGASGWSGTRLFLIVLATWMVRRRSLAESNGT